jgi:hypothetical protein
MEDVEIKAGGFTFRGWYIAAALPVLSGLSGGIYYGYDTISRFNGLEASVVEVLDATSRIQAIEQTLVQNNVDGLNTQLTTISTQMTNILEQQRTLMDLRSKVDRSATVTDGIGDKLDTYDMEIEDLWKAFDDLVKNPIR